METLHTKEEEEKSKATILPLFTIPLDTEAQQKIPEVSKSTIAENSKPALSIFNQKGPHHRGLLESMLTENPKLIVPVVDPWVQNQTETLESTTAKVGKAKIPAGSPILKSLLLQANVINPQEHTQFMTVTESTKTEDVKQTFPIVDSQVFNQSDTSESTVPEDVKPDLPIVDPQKQFFLKDDIKPTVTIVDIKESIFTDEVKLEEMLKLTTSGDAKPIVPVVNTQEQDQYKILEPTMSGYVKSTSPIVIAPVASAPSGPGSALRQALSGDPSKATRSSIDTTPPESVLLNATGFFRKQKCSVCADIYAPMILNPAQDPSKDSNSDYHKHRHDICLYTCPFCLKEEPPIFSQPKHLLDHVKAIHVQQINSECKAFGYSNFSGFTTKKQKSVPQALSSSEHAYANISNKRKTASDHDTSPKTIRPNKNTILIKYQPVNTERFVSMPFKSLSNDEDISDTKSKRKQESNSHDSVTFNNNTKDLLCKKQRTRPTNFNEIGKLFHGYYKCVQCGNKSRVYRTLRCLKTHYKVYHPSTPWPTQYEYECPNEQILIFKCPICVRNFSSSLELKNHARSEHPQDKALFTSCALCYKLLAQPGALTEHHVHEKTFYSCPKCQHAEYSFKKLYQHVRSMHIVNLGFESHDKESNELWICSHCLKVFYAGPHLEEHLAKKCLKQSKITGSFVETPTLQEHLKLCTFGCEIYVSSFLESMHHMLHAGQGVGTVVYSCGMCSGFRASNIAPVVRHVKTHEQLFRYKITLIPVSDIIN